ncbi:MAG: phosphatase PAP2 family protein [Roseburia sp.]|nr:phosphatase PAP2 family protein [Roseburia sp.]
MTKETYIKITEPLRKHPGKTRLVISVNKVLTGLVYLAYPAFLLLLFWKKEPFLLRAVLVPAISFVGVSLFRQWYNAPRPYEKFDIPPVIAKDTKGKSFPSRHVFSVFVIAITVFEQYQAAGLVLCVVGIGLALIRVLGGVHEPRDVVAGAIIGIFSGVLGYYML